MLNDLKNTLEKPSMRIYLQILAVFYGYGAIVHIFNLLGFGELSWQEMPLSWKLGDIFYGMIDPFTAVGLFLRKIWGILLLLTAACSQLILYSGFSQWFTFTTEQQQTLWSLVIFHLLSLCILGILFWVLIKKMQKEKLKLEKNIDKK